ncbi:RING finger and WD repeat domain-containing protein 3, partial [Nowakowskiella sp. JEL0078]
MAYDTQQVDCLQQELSNTKSKLDDTQRSLSQISMMYKSSKDENSMLRKEIQSMKFEFQRTKLKLGENDNSYNIPPSFRISETDSMRFPIVAKAESKLCHGLQFISLKDSSHTVFTKIHQNLIRDIQSSPWDKDLIMTISVDKTLKLFSIKSNSVVQSYDLDSAGWSCCFDAVKKNIIYAGQQNNRISIFNVNNTKLTSMYSIDTSAISGLGQGIHSISSILLPNQLGNNEDEMNNDLIELKTGLLGASPKSAFWIEVPLSEDTKMTALNITSP